MAFLTHACTAFIAFTAGYCWCFRTWNEWAPKRAAPKEKP